jgi:hypothetical protein
VVTPHLHHTKQKFLIYYSPRKGFLHLSHKKVIQASVVDIVALFRILYSKASSIILHRRSEMGMALALSTRSPDLSYRLIFSFQECKGAAVLVAMSNIGLLPDV